MSQIAIGKVAFSNVTEHDIYKGKSTGKYTLTITMDEEQAQLLRDQGVNVKEYEGTPQRKFTTGYPITMVDAADREWVGEIPRGSEVKVLWKAGEPNEEYGTPTYMNRIRVVTVGEEEEIPEEF